MKTSMKTTKNHHMGLVSKLLFTEKRLKGIVYVNEIKKDI